MQGQIVARGERRWLVRVFLGRDAATGRRRYHNHMVSGPKKDAERYLNAALRSKDLGTFAEPTRTTLDAYLDRWLEEAIKVRPRTRQDYEQILRLYVRPVLGPRRLDRLTPLDVQGVVNDLAARVRGQTARKAHRVLKQALKQAVEWRFLATNPASGVTLPEAHRLEMKALSPEEAQQFREACDAHDAAPAKAEDGRAKVRLPRGIVFLFSIATGMRPGEVLALRWEDVDFEAGTATVRRNLVTLRGSRIYGEPKTAKGRRTIPLPSGILQRLRAHRRQQAEQRLAIGHLYADEDLVFATGYGGPLDPRKLTQSDPKRARLGDLKSILKRAGLPASLRWYDLRHTFATNLLAAGADVRTVSDLLGHEQISLTLDLYAHSLPAMKQAAMGKMEAILFGPR